MTTRTSPGVGILTEYTSRPPRRQGKSYKRARIGGRGRIKPYKKFGSHVFIKVEER